ncbi:MAG: B12-binding domain-containing radical SAM protein [Candidatus Sumerlaeota bacterium]|nr:B12-binding domain-containing radical SAM protein [Candidatus Sumerlaeota bacterium]
MRILLAQLGGQRIAYGRIRDNEPVAAGLLKAALVASKVCALEEVEILGRDESDYFGDAMLAQAVTAKEPDVLGLSLYCWNTARSLWLAREIRQKLPRCRIVAGGPEVARDNWIVLQRGGFDALFTGEGEIAFAHYIARLKGVPASQFRVPSSDPLVPSSEFRVPSQKSRIPNPESRTPNPQSAIEGAPLWHDGDAYGAVDLAWLPSPYLMNYLDPKRDSYLIFETLRGCPFHCIYCAYNKSSENVRYYPLDSVEKTLRYAIERGVSDVFFMDPTFNVRPDFAELLAMIEKVNADRRLSLHTEIKADALKPGDAAAMERCGFSVVEVGLQTSNPEILRRIQRPTDLKRVVAGVHSLQDAQIDVMLDLILGLPGEDKDSVARSMEFVEENEIGTDVQVFPLAVLPASQVREQAAAWGIAYDPEPPYLVTATPQLTEPEINSLYQGAEDFFDTTFDPADPPPLTEWPAVRLSELGEGRCVNKIICEFGESGKPKGGNGHGGASGLAVSEAAKLASLMRLSPILANNIVFWIKTSRLGPRLGALQRVIEQWTSDNPNIVISLVIEALGLVSSDEILELGDASQQDQDHFLNHYHRHRFGGVASCNWQTFILLDDETDLPDRWLEDIEENFVVVTRMKVAIGDPIQELAGAIDEREDVLLDLPPEELEGKGAKTRAAEWMDSLAALIEYPDLVHFSHERAEKLWTTRILGSQDFQRFPEMIVRL